MKRFLVIFSVLCACFAQAISLNWSASGDTAWAKNINTANTALVYVDTPGAERYSASQIGEAVLKEQPIDGAVTVIDKAQGRFTMSPFPVLGLDGEIIIDNRNVKATGDFYLVLFTNDNKYAVGYIDGDSGVWYEAGPAEDYPSYSVTFDGTAVVPEPTALALLALGIAGLALRRRA